MSITSTGIGSGLDVEGLVSQLVQAEDEPVQQRIAQEERFLQAELSAYGTVRGAMSGLQSAISDVKEASTFSKRTVTSSDSLTISATASPEAFTGTYQVEVSSLAASQSLATGAFAEKTDTVGEGTLTFKFGTTDYDSGSDTYNGFSQNAETSTTSIVIDSANNTLEGIRDAINDADFGVAAVIVNDGTGYRLLLNVDETGASHSLEVSVSGDSDLNDTDNAGLSALSFHSSAHHLTQTSAATDAAFTVNGLAVTSDSNRVTGVLDGVTLNLNQVTDEPIRIAVAEDRAAVKTAIERFVNSYRAFNAVSNDLSRFDESTGEGSILIGDATLRSIANQVRQVINTPVDNLSGPFSMLSEIGITTDQNGSLNIDSTKLDAAIEENIEALTGLFASLGTIADDTIEYVSSTSDTVAGDYDIEITQLATRGEFVASGVLPDFGSGSVTIDDNNDSLTLSVNGVEGSAFTLTQGTYTSGAALAQELQSRINGVPEFADAGISVTVSYDAGANALTVTSDRYGSESSVDVTGIDPNTASSLGFSVTDGTDGVDVAGTIGGVAGVGSGQTLKGGEGTDVEGLSLLVTGGSVGVRGTLSFGRGIADQLDSRITSMLSSEGILESRTSGINSSLERLEEDLARHETRMETIEARYRDQFGSLDTLLAQLNSTGNFLSQALASLPKPNSVSKK